MLIAIFIFCLSLALSVGLTLLARKIAPWLGLIDRPGGRRKHPYDVARLGALPLWGAFTITALIAHPLIPGTDPNEVIRLTGLLLGGTFLFFFGLLDDRFDLPGVVQGIAQIVAAGIGVAFLIFIQFFNNPLTRETVELPYLLIIIVSMFWLGLMMNTVNFLDGVDGVAGGVTVIASALLFIHTLIEGQLSVSLLPMALIGTAIGFLLFNWHPASIFMGSGAIFLGYTLGALAIIGGAKMATILLVMGLPLLDLTWQGARRLLTGKNPLVGDRGHLHFRLIDAGVSPRWIAVGYYVFCAAFGALALLTTSRQFKLIALVIMVVLVLVGFALVARFRKLPES